MKLHGLSTWGLAKREKIKIDKGGRKTSFMAKFRMPNYLLCRESEETDSGAVINTLAGR